MSKVVFVLSLIVVLALGYLALENPTTIQLKIFHRGPTNVSLSMIIFGAFVLGALFVYVIFLFLGVRGAFQAMKERRNRKRDEVIDNHRLEARKLARVGHLGKARGLLEKAIRLAPDNLELHLDLADLLMEQKEYATAADRYHHLLSRDPQNLRAILGIAVGAEESGNLSDAEFYYSRLLDIEKLNPVALSGLLRTQRGQAKWEEAVDTFWQIKRQGLVSERDSEETPASIFYEQGIHEKTSGNLKKSVDAFEKSLKAAVGFVPSILGLGEAYIEEGSPDRAIKIWEKTLMEKFQYPVARKLEDYLTQQGREKDLLQFYRRASSREVLARILLARLYLRMNKIGEAEEEIAATPGNEGSPGALLILAEIEKKRSNEVLSNRYYGRTIELLRPHFYEYRCNACSTPYDRYMDRCKKCGSWNAVEIALLLP